MRLFPENYALWLPVVLTPAVVLVLALPWLAGTDRACSSPCSRLDGGLRRILCIFIFIRMKTGRTFASFCPLFPAVILVILLAGRAMVVRWPARVGASRLHSRR